MTEQEIFELIGKLLSLLFIGAAGAGGFIKLWGQKWIENKFTKDLETFKAQKLHEFNLLLTRKTKWHEKEHEVLSLAWQKLVQAHTSLKEAISMFKQYSDLNNMSEEEVEEFLESNDFSDDEKKHLRKSKKNYNIAFSEILDHRALKKAHKSFLEFHTYFDENRIFLRPHVKEKFQKADDYIWSAWVSQKMSLRAPESKRDFGMEAFETENKKLKPLVEDIEDCIQKELFPAEYDEKTQADDAS